MNRDIQLELKSVAQQIQDTGRRVETCDNAYHLGILCRSLCRNIETLAKLTRDQKESEK